MYASRRNVQHCTKMTSLFRCKIQNLSSEHRTKQNTSSRFWWVYFSLSLALSINSTAWVRITHFSYPFHSSSPILDLANKVRCCITNCDSQYKMQMANDTVKLWQWMGNSAKCNQNTIRRIDFDGWFIGISQFSSSFFAVFDRSPILHNEMQNQLIKLLIEFYCSFSSDSIIRMLLKGSGCVSLWNNFILFEYATNSLAFDLEISRV